MKILVTGASGFVGRNIIPLLDASGAKLLLCGRDTQLLKKTFPGFDTCVYEDIADRARGFDVLLHLAVLNNGIDHSEAKFWVVNVDLAVSIANAARQAGVGRFVNVSSVHALDPSNCTPYATTKREAVHVLEAMEGLKIETVYLPLVYGTSWSGRISFLNRFPSTVARALFLPIAALKPTVNVRRIAEFVLSPSVVARGDECILSDDQDRNIVFKATKRLADILFVVTVLVLLGWALILIWALIRLQSPGPGIFAQERVGKNGKTFICYKFRTMKVDTVQAGTHEVPASAVTKLGHFLRRTKADELPQIWNILRNEVTLIGPRPCLPVQQELVAARKRLGVLALKPGISGLAQINNVDMSDPAKLARWDARYKALRSIVLDLKITVATAIGRGQGDKIK